MGSGPGYRKIGIGCMMILRLYRALEAFLVAATTPASREIDLRYGLPPTVMARRDPAVFAATVSR